MTVKPFFVKDPQAILPYSFDWKGLTNGVPGATSDWLPAGEIISSYDLTVPTGLTLVSHALQLTNTRVTVELSGGVVGQKYTVSCKITTNVPNHSDERSIYIDVRQR